MPDDKSKVSEPDRSRVAAEANSAPGFQGLEKACGISVPEEIFKAVQKKYNISITARDTSWQRLIRGAQEYLSGAESIFKR